MTRRTKIIIGVISAPIILLVIIYLALLGLAKSDGQKLEAALNSVEQQNWKLTESNKSGNQLCFNACMNYDRDYRADLTTSEAKQLFPSLIQEAGFKITNTDNSCVGEPKNKTKCYFVEGEKGKQQLSLEVVDISGGNLSEIHAESEFSTHIFAP